MSYILSNSFSFIQQIRGKKKIHSLGYRLLYSNTPPTHSPPSIRMVARVDEIVHSETGEDLHGVKWSKVRA